MSELVILVNYQSIYCNSEQYYCNGAIVLNSDIYQTTSYNEIDFVTLTMIDTEYVFLWIIFLDSNDDYLITSDSMRFKVKTSEITDMVEY